MEYFHNGYVAHNEKIEKKNKTYAAILIGYFTVWILSICFSVILNCNEEDFSNATAIQNYTLYLFLFLSAVIIPFYYIFDRLIDNLPPKYNLVWFYKLEKCYEYIGYSLKEEDVIEFLYRRNGVNYFEKFHLYQKLDGYSKRYIYETLLNPVEIHAICLEKLYDTQQEFNEMSKDQNKLVEELEYGEKLSKLWN